MRHEPRKPSQRSLANLEPNRGTPGMESVTVRIFAANLVCRWFKDMSSADRGKLLATIHQSLDK